jgi:hypothetical protein
MMKTENYITIEGADSKLLIKALQDFANSYADTNMVNDIELYMSKSNNRFFVVNINELMDIERFQFLVNYLEYPIDIKYQAEVKGYWNVSSMDKLKINHVGQRVMFYVSPNDKEGDNVFGIFKDGSQTIKFGFSSHKQYKELDKKEMDFIEPELYPDDFEKCGNISPDPKQKLKKGMGCMLTFSFFLLLAAGITIAVILLK